MNLRAKRTSALFLLAFNLSAQALAADYATCLLDKLPGVKNAPAHAAALNPRQVS